ncbi:hypothetical protein ACOME3_008752 [Neoechinorhynchus agilis]
MRIDLFLTRSFTSASAFCSARVRTLKNGGRNWICTRGNVVYEMECKRCLNDANRKVTYIGKTERPLRQRITKHVRSALNLDAKSYIATPWTKHQAELHRDGKVEIITQVRFVARDPVELSIAEALLISRAVGRESDNGSVTDEASKVPRESLNKRDELSASMSLL